MFELLVEVHPDEGLGPVVRCLAGHASPGDVVMQAASPDGLSLELASDIESIERYPGVFTDRLEVPHVARLLLQPPLPAVVSELWRLHGQAR